MYVVCKEIFRLKKLRFLHHLTIAKSCVARRMIGGTWYYGVSKARTLEAIQNTSQKMDHRRKIAWPDLNVRLWLLQQIDALQQKIPDARDSFRFDDVDLELHLLVGARLDWYPLNPHVAHTKLHTTACQIMFQNIWKCAIIISIFSLAPCLEEGQLNAKALQVL